MKEKNVNEDNNNERLARGVYVISNKRRPFLRLSRLVSRLSLAILTRWRWTTRHNQFKSVCCIMFHACSFSFYFFFFFSSHSSHLFASVFAQHLVVTGFVPFSIFISCDRMHPQGLHCNVANGRELKLKCVRRSVDRVASTVRTHNTHRIHIEHYFARSQWRARTIFVCAFAWKTVWSACDVCVRTAVHRMGWSQRSFSGRENAFIIKMNATRLIVCCATAASIALRCRQNATHFGPIYSSFVFVFLAFHSSQHIQLCNRQPRTRRATT